MFTTISQEQQDGNIRKEYQQLIITIYGIVFFISLSSQIYHLVGMMTTERASGMAQLIDAMGGNPAIRICSYILSFNIIYAPSWIAFGICKPSYLPSSSFCCIYFFTLTIPLTKLSSALERSFQLVERPHFPGLADPNWDGPYECQRLRCHVL
jgi:hypothetical protein